MGPGDNGRGGLGLALAILLSALAHIGLLYSGLVLIPRWLAEQPAPPPVYTVAVVDNLPAGDLGTHLPQLNRPQSPPRKTLPPPRPPKPPKTAKASAPNSDTKAFALNKRGDMTPTPTPTPTPAQATAAPTVPPTPRPTARPTRRATTRPTATAHRVMTTPRPTARAKRPRPTATPRARRAGPRETPKRMLAQATPKPTPGVREQMAALRKQLLLDSLKHRKVIAQRHEGEGGGPLESNVSSGGQGYGVGPGHESAGMLKDPLFLLYYTQVQERIKKAWTFSGGNSDLTATIEFAIGPDGQLLNYQVQRSSRNDAYDESVIRAIKRAAPFPPPPPDYRDAFSRGVEATFRLGELNS
ncbi:MAG TPA: energy transducer TonB [Candidatus Binataceae bacterium]|nr:energy transducer TonB [Candidatus Binataceae bacterium]